MRVWENGAFRLAAYNTFRFSVVAVPLAVVLSLFLAVVMESRIPFKSQFRTFFLSPMMVPVASVVLIWQVLFHYNGLVNEWMLAIGQSKIDWLKSDHAGCNLSDEFGYMYISALPNASFPGRQSDRMIFQNNEAYFTDRIRSIADSGADIIGGCCGTNPQYIKRMAQEIDWKQRFHHFPVPSDQQQDHGQSYTQKQRP